MIRLGVKFDFGDQEEQALQKYQAMKSKAHAKIFDVENYQHVLTRAKMDSVKLPKFVIIWWTVADKAEGGRVESNIQVLR